MLPKRVRDDAELPRRRSSSIPEKYIFVTLLPVVEIALVQ